VLPEHEARFVDYKSFTDECCYLGPERNDSPQYGSHPVDEINLQPLDSFDSYLPTHNFVLDLGDKDDEKRVVSLIRSSNGISKHDASAVNNFTDNLMGLIQDQTTTAEDSEMQYHIDYSEPLLDGRVTQSADTLICTTRQQQHHHHHHLEHESVYGPLASANHPQQNQQQFVSGIQVTDLATHTFTNNSNSANNPYQIVSWPSNKNMTKGKLVFFL
jgi:hypothetical protein